MRIGISGKIGSGKSTVCLIIKELYPEFTTAAFATRVKETCAALTGMDIKHFYSREGKKIVYKPFGKTLGQILQESSEALKLAFGNDMWVRIVNGVNLVEDVRFKVEANSLTEQGYTLLRIEGDPAKIRERNEDLRDLNHISETDLDNYPFEHVIYNDGTLEELREKVIGFLEKM